MRSRDVSPLNEDQIAERGARMARRDDRECREHLREEQRSQPGCPCEVARDQRRHATSRAAAMLACVCVALIATSACRKSYNAEASHLTGGDPRRGVEAIGRYGCGACHDIPGIQNARGTVGPPLARIASRTYLAGRVTNTPADMVRWIQHPQQIEPGTAMPEMGVTDIDARDIAAYLYTLR